MDAFNTIFGTPKPIIAALHFLPLPGYPDHQSLDLVKQKAQADLKLLVAGGVDGIIVENNYDLPHRITVGPETVAAMSVITTQLVKAATIPIGVSVLWNDYQAALAIAHASGAKFIRIPAFVDDVITDYGLVRHVAEDVKAYQTKISATNIAIFTDIHVKHARLQNPTKTLEQSIAEAIAYRTDAIIITGQWTGDAPALQIVTKAKQTAGSTPILIGSGANHRNISQLLSQADGAIVSTSLKVGENQSQIEQTNLKPAQAVFDLAKIKQFIQAARF